MSQTDTAPEWVRIVGARYWLRPFWDDLEDGEDFQEFPSLAALLEFAATKALSPYSLDIFFGRLLETREYDTELYRLNAERRHQREADQAAAQEAADRATYERLKAKYEGET